MLSGDGCCGIPIALLWGMCFPDSPEPTLQRVYSTAFSKIAAGLVISIHQPFVMNQAPVGDSVSVVPLRLIGIEPSLTVSASSIADSGGDCGLAL
jgi:hypothetical protein